MQSKKNIIRYKESVLIAVVVLFYSVGIIGMTLLNERAYFASLSFLNLLLSFTLVLLARKTNWKRFIGFLAFSFSIGIIVELIGVHTGLLFGSYQYGENLGIKWFEVPIIIGLNWGILVVISASLVYRFPVSNVIKIILATVFMVLLDFLMEPVANDLDFWSWKNDQIPVYNFVCWFAISLILQYFYFNFNKLAESNRVFNVLYVVMVVFFSLLNLL
ncbi:MAG: carotenoid biosynthesis protein [Crocinitomicaceae bacterium]|nr:carotenoid biosynthesis protein [Crocinitomicaceae bacterium]